MKLVLFDADGTLVDSQHALIESMHAGFRAVDREPPRRSRLSSVAGMTPKHAFATLLPLLGESEIAEMAWGFRKHYFEIHKQSKDGTALFPGVREMLEHLNERGNLMLGIATGKSDQATDLMMDQFELRNLFQTVQMADAHPSKPHPSMVRAAMRDARVTAENTVVVGDTVMDIAMAKAGGVTGIGVSWGFHDSKVLKSAGAAAVLEQIEDLPNTLSEIWG